MPYLILFLLAFSLPVHATNWCDLPESQRTECLYANSPLRSHPGNCPAREEMSECPKTSYDLCQIRHYAIIGAGFDALNEELLTAITRDPNSPTITLKTIYEGNIEITKPIKLPAEKKLEQVGQQEYWICLKVETRTPLTPVPIE